MKKRTLFSPLLYDIFWIHNKSHKNTFGLKVSLKTIYWCISTRYLWVFSQKRKVSLSEWGKKRGDYNWNKLQIRHFDKKKKIQFETYSFLLGIGMYGHLKGSHRTSFDMIWLSELCEIKIIVCIISCLFTNGLTPIHSVLFDFFESLHLTFPWALFGVQIFLDHRSPILGTRCIWGFRVIHWLPKNKILVIFQDTMLKKLSNCEVKAWLCWNLMILPPLRFYVKSNFGEFKRSKNVIFGNFRDSEL